MAICTIESSKTILCSIYRPPDAEEAAFTPALKFIQDYNDKQSVEKHYKINIMGDFNLPEISWSTDDQAPTLNMENSKCTQALLSFMDKNLLS